MCWETGDKSARYKMALYLVVTVQCPSRITVHLPVVLKSPSLVGPLNIHPLYVDAPLYTNNHQNKQFTWLGRHGLHALHHRSSRSDLPSLIMSRVSTGHQPACSRNWWHHLVNGWYEFLNHLWRRFVLLCWNFGNPLSQRQAQSRWTPNGQWTALWLDGTRATSSVQYTAILFP